MASRRSKDVLFATLPCRIPAVLVETSHNNVDGSPPVRAWSERPCLGSWRYVEQRIGDVHKATGGRSMSTHPRRAAYRIFAGSALDLTGVLSSAGKGRQRGG